MKILYSFTALTALALAGTAQAADLTEERVNELISQYLQDNPQAIIDSLQNFQMKQEADKIKDQVNAVKELQPYFNKKDNHYGEAGNPNGDVTIVEFFDYNCPACKMMFEGIDSLLQEDNKIRVIFVEYPIFGPVSDENAKISFAVQALAPQKYYKFHEAAMRQKGKIDAEGMLTIAANLGIDKAKLKTEAAKPKYNDYIAKDRELAQQLQITGTPALIIGQQIANGALQLSQLQEYVRWAREDTEGEEKAE